MIEHMLNLLRSNKQGKSTEHGKHAKRIDHEETLVYDNRYEERLEFLKNFKENYKSVKNTKNSE